MAFRVSVSRLQNTRVSAAEENERNTYSSQCPPADEVGWAY